MTAAGLFLCSGGIWGRAIEVYWALDVRAQAIASPIIFRGEVIKLKTIRATDENHLEALAQFEPDRWYRGQRPAEVWVHFTWDAFSMLNHDCENLEVHSRWLVFAAAIGGRLELVRDCHGVLPVAAQLGGLIQSGDYLNQMEVDFAAGRRDPELSRRLWSLWWLGGLQMPSAQTALQRWIETSSGIEQYWARFAMARSVGHPIYPDFYRQETGYCQAWIDAHAKSGSDPDPLNWAKEGLKTARDELGLGCAIRALGESKSHSVLEAIASRLEDPRSSVRWDALAAIMEITGSATCAPSESRETARKCADSLKRAGR
jgi:hypothetical protein